MEINKYIPNKLFSKSSDKIKNVKKKASKIVKEIQEEEKALKMLFKFNLNLEDGKDDYEEEKNDTSTIPVEEEKDK